MPPNPGVKPAFLKTHGPSKNVCDDRNSIRTDFILQNIFSHVISPLRNYEALEATNESEKNLIHELKQIVDSFRENYVSDILQYCSEMYVTLETLASSVRGVANELFCEGITWSRIVGFFVFIGGFSQRCLSLNLDIDVVYEVFCRFTKENLTGWIEDHGGWDGVRSLSEEKEKIQPSNKGWVKSLLHGTVRAFGIFAQLANNTQAYP